MLQPIVQLVMAPDCCNTGKIPNEDSRAFEWDDTKLFSADRFTGLDRVDAGSRVNYGVEWSAYNNEGTAAPRSSSARAISSSAAMTNPRTAASTAI